MMSELPKPFIIGESILVTIGGETFPAEYRGSHYDSETMHKMVRVIVREIGKPPCELSVRLSQVRRKEGSG
jgi:hypothetical protein